MDSALLRDQFFHLYGPSQEPIHEFKAPGRVNLMGDHTDYNGGLVFPCAIDRGIHLLIRKRADRLVKLNSQNFDLVAFLSPQDRIERFGDHWINFPLGVIQQFEKKGLQIEGFDFLYAGNVPNGAGLSSSAAIEVVTAFALNHLMNTQFSTLDLVKMAKAAENEFVGVPCGIMDQFAVAMAKEGHGMMLDCQTLEAPHVPLDLGSHQIVIVNSNQRRDLTEGHYQERFNECLEALDIMKKNLNITALAQMDFETLRGYESELGPKLYKRTRHVVTEHQRVISSVQALQAGNLQEFGQLMMASHQSLRDDYEVSCPALNALTDIAAQIDGVQGSRLTGAGFGGCTVNLVRTKYVEEFIQQLGHQYQVKTGLTADFYPIKVGGGVKEVYDA